MSTFEEAIITEVTKKALKEIDTDAMAKRLRPRLETKIEAGIAGWIQNDFYWDDIMQQEAIQDALEAVCKKTVLDALGVLPKTTKKGSK